MEKIQIFSEQNITSEHNLHGDANQMLRWIDVFDDFMR